MAARNSAGSPPPSPWFHWKPSGMDTAESSSQSADFVTNSISIQLQRGGCGALFPYPLPHPVPTPSMRIRNFHLVYENLMQLKVPVVAIISLIIWLFLPLAGFAKLPTIYSILGVNGNKINATLIK